MMRIKKYLFILFAFMCFSISNFSAFAQEATPTNDTTLTQASQVEVSNSNVAFIEQSFIDFVDATGFANLDWQTIVMIFVACLLLYLAIVKQFEPLLLMPIAFGMLLTNLPGAGLYDTSLFAGGHVHWDLFDRAGLLDYLYLGVKLGIYPCLIFIGVGAMTDFGPMLANPKSLLLGAAAQFGIFATYLGAIGLGFLPREAASIGIIGGADGPTAIYLTTKLAPELLGPIAVAAYSYMALVPVIQPPIMRFLTTKKERAIKMSQLRIVSKKEKIIFPIFATAFISLLLPPAAPLIGSLMLGNLLKESGVAERLSKTVQNELMNITTIFLGVTVGATATSGAFLNIKTLEILSIGILAFSLGTGSGVLLAKFMNLFTKEKVNPLIGSAGVSAVPMAARVSQVVGQETDPSNFLLMHAMGPNVAGVIGSAVAAGIMLTMLG
ncbi:MAG: sodium ion-translocating decarboxylase subunit beta [Paludibacter sp.]|nr:sodium ion-translocating decarboxylase subunit beta [Paludibacter sp.]